jgi:hypothetical protein
MVGGLFGEYRRMTKKFDYSKLDKAQKRELFLQFPKPRLVKLLLDSEIVRNTREDELFQLVNDLMSDLKKFVELTANVPALVQSKDYVIKSYADRIARIENQRENALQSGRMKGADSQRSRERKPSYNK